MVNAMEHINESGELTMTTGQSKHDHGSTKFFAIVAAISFAFGVYIALFDFMRNSVSSAIVSLLFIFVGSACSMVAGAKFLQSISDAPEDNDQTH